MHRLPRACDMFGCMYVMRLMTTLYQTSALRLPSSPLMLRSDVCLNAASYTSSLPPCSFPFQQPCSHTRQSKPCPSKSRLFRPGLRWWFLRTTHHQRANARGSRRDRASDFRLPSKSGRRENRGAQRLRIAWFRFRREWNEATRAPLLTAWTAVTRPGWARLTEGCGSNAAGKERLRRRWLLVYEALKVVSVQTDI